MDFDTLDKEMRQYETASDNCFVPNLNLVVRLDGRGFSGLTRDNNFEKPFDNIFHTYMVETTRQLMADSGFDFKYGYTQSDEISLWFMPNTNFFNRKERKLVSILAGSGSAYFTLQLGKPAVFDARICQLPTEQLLVDYFRWRQEDASRNALNGYCYWMLRKEGLNERQASNQLENQGNSFKNEFLFERGINFNDVTPWHKRGTGFYWEQFQKVGVNPLTNQEVEVTRNRLKIDDNLPAREGYTDYILARIKAD